MLGTPPQTVRLLPSITGSTIWVVLPQGCQDSSVSTCNFDRGGIFAVNQSSTWEQKGFFQLPLDPEHYLPFTGAAQFGFDNMTFDWQGDDVMSVDHQVVAGYKTNDFYIGALGLSPVPVHIANISDQYPSFVGMLKKGNHIPSYSYSYTAGASYRSFPLNAFGSLTLGGYDSTRMDASKNLTIVGGSDTYRPLLLGIESIRSGSAELLDAPIITALNSLVTQIWLPISACQRFESAFGLVWSSAHELYLVNETQHSALLSQNVSITFTLSTGAEDQKDKRLDISLPYAAFDLTAKPPYAGLNETMYYFPLKRAANDTQYTLGRTILQETYMIADYERGALSLFPAIFSDSSIEQNLVPINPVDDVSGSTITQVNPHGGLSRTAIIGIVVGSIVIVILVAAGAIFCMRRRTDKKVEQAISKASDPWEKPELASCRTYYRTELEGHVPGDTEHNPSPPVVSSHCRDSPISSTTGLPLLEMPGDLGGAELDPNCQIYELPGFHETTK